MILDWTASHTSLLMAKADIIYLVLYRWMVCGFSSIHRYLEREQKEPLDPVGICLYDAERGIHDICSGPLSFCYARSMFFVLNPFREISPWQNREYLYQFFVTIIWAFLAAFCVSVCELYLQNNDDTELVVYERKIKEIEKYCKYLSLKSELERRFLPNNWLIFKSIRTNRMDILSPSCKIDITSLLQNHFIIRTPILNQSSDSLRRNISSYIRPQVNTYAAR